MDKNKAELDARLLHAVAKMQVMEIVALLKNEKGFDGMTTSTERALEEFYLMGFKSGVEYVCALQSELPSRE